MVRLRDIMTKEVLTVSPDLPIRDLMELMVTRHVSGVPVVTGGKVVGVVSTTDLMSFTTGLLAGSSEDAPAPEEQEANPEQTDDATAQVDEPMGTWFTEMWSEDRGDVSSRLDGHAESTSDLDSQTVADVMTRPPLCTMLPDTAIDHAADYMRRTGVHRVLVMTGDRLEGIVTTTDLANAVADHKNVIRTFVFDRHGGQLS